MNASRAVLDRVDGVSIRGSGPGRGRIAAEVADRSVLVSAG
jgi:hypothetical protein